MCGPTRMGLTRRKNSSRMSNCANLHREPRGVPACISPIRLGSNSQPLPVEQPPRGPRSNASGTLKWRTIACSLLGRQRHFLENGESTVLVMKFAEGKESTGRKLALPKTSATKLLVRQLGAELRVLSAKPRLAAGFVAYKQMPTRVGIVFVCRG